MSPIGKERVAEKRIQWTRRELIVRWGVFGFLLVLCLLVLWFSFAEEFGRNQVQAGADLTLPVSDLKAGKLFLFSYPIDPFISTQLAVQRGEDGVIRVAFASCRGCWRFHHYDWFGKLVCGRCGHYMKLPDPSEKPDNQTKRCVPVPLAYSIQGDKLLASRLAITSEFERWFRSDMGKPTRP